MEKLKMWACHHIDAITYGVAYASVIGLMYVCYRLGQLDC